MSADEATELRKQGTLALAELIYDMYVEKEKM